MTQFFKLTPGLERGIFASVDWLFLFVRLFVCLFVCLTV